MGRGVSGRVRQPEECPGGGPGAALPGPEAPLPVGHDASAEGVGAVLSQVKEGRERVVAYYSVKFSKPERSHCVTRKELLAVVRSPSTHTSTAPSSPSGQTTLPCGG